MANDLTITAALEWLDSLGSPESLPIKNLIVSVATETCLRTKYLATTSVTAIPLGALSSLGFAIFVNRDTTNYIEIYTSTSGVIFAQLLAGEVALLRLGSGAQVPAVKAHTASCFMEYLIASL